MDETHHHRNDHNDVKNILIWLVLGAVVGWIASSIVGTRSNLALDIVVGIAGSFIGGWVMGKTGHSHSHEIIRPGEFSWRSFFVALLGAIILLVIVKILS